MSFEEKNQPNEPTKVISLSLVESDSKQQEPTNAPCSCELCEKNRGDWKTCEPVREAA